MIITWTLDLCGLQMYTFKWSESFGALGIEDTLSSLHLSESFIWADLELLAEVSSCSPLWLLGCQR